MYHSFIAKTMESLFLCVHIHDISVCLSHILGNCMPGQQLVHVISYAT